MAALESEARIAVHVYPNASRNEVIGCQDGVLRVRVAAPPIKGKANRELISFLSKILGVAKGSIDIARGHTSRNKVIVIHSLSQEEVDEKLSPRGS